MTTKKQNDVGSSNGRTPEFESGCSGSNPFPTTNEILIYSSTGQSIALLMRGFWVRIPMGQQGQVANTVYVSD